MASSPLTLAMLGGGGGSGAYSPYGMAMYDPASLGAMQRIGLAQGMIGHGLDSSAAYPAQALSRLGEALIGSMMLKKGYGELQGANQAKQSQLGAIDNLIYGDQPTQAAPQPAAPAVAPQSSAPTSGTPFAANNPLNMRFAGQPGATNTNGFAAFDTPQSGQSATDNQFKLYADRGINTVRGLVSHWAPPNENDTEGYIKRVSQTTGIDPDAQIDLTNPTVSGAVQRAMAGVEGNKNAGVQVAQAGNVATDAVPQGSPAQGAAPPPSAAPQVGLQNPGVQHFMEVQRTLAPMLSSLDPVIRQHAQIALEAAKQRLEFGSVYTMPDGTQVNTITGQRSAAAAPNANYVQTAPGVYTDTTNTHTPYALPAPRIFTDIHHNVGAVGPGGQPYALATNPSGITGDTPEANAARTLIELRSNVQNGTASPDEMARYNLAFSTFQHPVVETNPATKQLGTIPTMQVPPGFPPQQGGAPASAAPQQQGAAPAGGPQINIPQGANPGFTPLTGSARGPEAAEAITTDVAKNDFNHLSEEQAKIQAGHNMLGTTATIRSMLPQVTEGTGAEQRLAAGRILAAAGINDPDTQKALTGTNVAAGELLQKKLFELSTGAVRGMGAREPGSVMQMFQKNYPQMTSRNMTIDAMTRLLDMDQIWKEDNASGQRDYLNGQVQGVGQNKPYGGLSGYTQPDPRVYQAAALASSNLPTKTWTNGLTPEQQTQAVQLVRRVYPDFVPNGYVKQ